MHFHGPVAEGLFPCGGSISDREFLFDSSETENSFGWKFRTFDEMIIDLAKQYLELSTRTGIIG